MQNTITPIHGNILHCLAEINIEDKKEAIEKCKLELEEIKGLERIRISSIEATELNSEVLNIIKDN